MLCLQRVPKMRLRHFILNPIKQLKYKNMLWKKNQKYNPFDPIYYPILLFTLDNC